MSTWRVVRGSRIREPVRPHTMAEGLTAPQAIEYSDVHGGWVEREHDGAILYPDGTLKSKDGEILEVCKD